MDNPLITLVTVVKNGAETLERALQSVAAQTYKQVEYIVLDGGSTDGTQAIIERYAYAIAYTHSRPDGGPSRALEEGYAMAKGQILGYLSADDWLAPDACAQIAAMYQKQPNTDIFCFAVQEHRQSEDGEEPTRIFTHPEGARFTLLEALYCHGVNRFYSRNVLHLLTTRFDRFPLLADRDVNVRLGLAKLSTARTNRVLYHFLVHSKSATTGGDRSMMTRQIAETCEIALDYLEHASLSREERRLIAEWYCFNAVRLVYFRLRAGQLGEALRDGAHALARFPLTLAKTLVCYKIPAPMRPRGAS